MPSRWYTDRPFWNWKKNKSSGKRGKPVGRADMVARVGDFFACEVVGEPLVITRDQDHKLRAFYNVCRHRAMLVAKGKGNRRSLQCMYHGWTYGLDGRLLNAPEFDGVENWQKDQVCLPEVQVAEWGPFIFVNLDLAAIPLHATSYGKIGAEIQS